MNSQTIMSIFLLFLCFVAKNNGFSKCENHGTQRIKNKLFQSTHTFASSNDLCDSLIIFDLSKNVMPEKIFNISIKSFLKSEGSYCEGFKYVIIDDNFNECGTSKGCNIVVNNCTDSIACVQVIVNLNFNNITSSYSDEVYDENSEESKNYGKFLKAVFGEICACQANTVFVLTNRIIYIPSDPDIQEMVENSFIKFTTILLGRNVSNTTELLFQDSNQNIPNARGLNFANYDCLNYLLYCLIPCSMDVPECLPTDIDDCQIITTAPNDNPVRTLHLWVVFAFNEPFDNNSYDDILQSLQAGIRNCINILAINLYRVRFVNDDQHITNSYEDVSLINSQNLPDIFLTKETGDINNNTEINQRLSMIPWSGTLTPQRPGILSIIILTNYATKNLQTYVNGQNLFGQMYIYNSNSFNYYKGVLKNDTNFELLLSQAYTDPIAIWPIGFIPGQSPTTTFETSTDVTVTTLFPSLTSSPSTSIQNNNKSLSTAAEIAIICGSIVGILIIVAVIAFKIYQTKKRNSEVGRMQMRHGRPQSIKRNHLGRASSYCDSWELTWDRLVIKNDELSTGANEQLLHGALLSDFKNGVYQSSSEVAIKMPNKHAIQIDRNRFFNEINMMKKVTEIDNIIALLGCITKGDQICMVFELCSNLDLLCYIREKKQDEKQLGENEKQTSKEFYIFAWQILHGLQSLSKKLIVHRNLTAKNVLISSEKNAKIADFGLAIHLSNNAEPVSAFERRKLPFKWLAIEILKNDEFSFQSDTWAFGIVLYEMYSFGKTPYEEIKNDILLDYLEAGNRLEKPEFCSDKIFEIMSKCWCEDPSTRPTTNEIILDFKEFLEQSTEGYGYLELMESAAANNSKGLMRQFSSFENS